MEEAEFPDYQAAVRRDVPRAFLIDVQEYFSRAAKQAKLAVTTSHTLIDGGIPLGVRRGNQLSGLIRYGITDEGFEQLVARHAGEPVGQVRVDGIDGPKNAPVYLTTARFGATLIGFASHHQADDLPVKNASRKALAAQNAGLGTDLFRPKELYVDRERFVLIMVRRDPSDVGKVASITMTMTDPQITQFIMQADLNEFLASYGSVPRTGTGIVMKKVAKRFRADDQPAEKTKSD